MGAGGSAKRPPSKRVPPSKVINVLNPRVLTKRMGKARAVDTVTFLRSSTLAVTAHVNDRLDCEWRESIIDELHAISWRRGRLIVIKRRGSLLVVSNR